MKTLTKAHLVQVLTASVSGLSLNQAKHAANDLILEFKSAIFRRETVYVPTTCRINVNVKPPRPGRNPKTGQECIIPSIHSITASDTGKGIQSDKLTKQALIDELATLTYTHKQAKEMVETFYAFISRVKDGNHKIELRGFGVFYPRINTNSYRHNPLTGERVYPGVRTKVAFKCSPSLRKAMDEEYL